MPFQAWLPLPLNLTAVKPLGAGSSLLPASLRIIAATGGVAHFYTLSQPRVFLKMAAKYRAFRY